MEIIPIIMTICAEIALALHPIAIKEIPANIPTQLLARLGTYSALSLILAGPSERNESWGSLLSASSSIALGLMNLVHIASSYISYSLLPAGTALALFYTYPFMNILAGYLFLGDSLDLRIIPLMILAFIGVILISRSTHEQDVKKPVVASDDGFRGVIWGIIMSLISAFTETLIFMVAKGEGGVHSPWLSMSRLYPGALLGLLAWIWGRGETIQTNMGAWIPLLIFNIFIGFMGYSLRFFSIPLLPTAIFSILTFVGVLAGYGWGVLLSKEIPTAGALAGAGCITGAIAILQMIMR